MKKFSRIISAILALSIAVSLCACGSSNSGKKKAYVRSGCQNGVEKLLSKGYHKPEARVVYCGCSYVAGPYINAFHEGKQSEHHI